MEETFIKASKGLVIGLILDVLGWLTLPKNFGLGAFILFFGSVLMLYTHCMFACCFAEVAESKGYDGLALFIFLSFIIGYIYVASLPDKNIRKNMKEIQNLKKEDNSVKYSSDELPDL